MSKFEISRKETKDTRQEFLLTFFDKDEYQEKEVQGFWLVKQYQGQLGKWVVGIYNQENFKRYKGFQTKENKKKEIQKQEMSKAIYRTGHRKCPMCKRTAETIGVYNERNILIGYMGFDCKNCGKQKKANPDEVEKVNFELNLP